MTVSVLGRQHEDEYEAYVRKSTRTLLFASVQYKNLLKEFLGAEDRYLVERDSAGDISGVMPVFARSGSAGTVLNSLPFYGSYGGVIEHRGNAAVRQQLLAAFNAMSDERRCAASTVICSPLEEDNAFYQLHFAVTHTSHRIGQVTHLPDNPEALAASFHQKTRNAIRKAVKSGVHAEWGVDGEKLSFVAETHALNMAEVGGIAKPRNFFSLIPKHFEAGKTLRIVTALLDGQPIAALLLFFYNRAVEYFTPVIREEFRGLQPLSLLISEAMNRAINERYIWWNWGGTWSTQEGVYRFKSRWGTTDHPYTYLTRVADEELLGKSKEFFLREYPYFFVLPFEALIAVGHP